MNRHLLRLGFLLLMLLPLSGVQAQVQVTTSLFYGSPYVWRGEVLSSGYVIQPSVSASYQGLSLTFFGNFDPKSGAASNKAHFNEADLTAAYGLSLGAVSMSAGYTYYTFPTPAEGELELNTSHEVFASLGTSGVPFLPRFMVAYDFEAYDGLYAELGIGHDLDVGGQAVNVGAALGLDNNFVLEDGTALSHVALTTKTDFVAGGFTVSPMAGFQISLDEAYRQFRGETFFYGGINIGF